MNIRLLAIGAIFFIYGKAKCQTQEELLNNYSRKAPIQKIHLQTDRENYIAGQTVWIKTYISTDYLPDTISTNLVTELIDVSTSKLYQTFTFPVLLSAATGSIDLPDDIETGYYLLRSYTPEMVATGNEIVSTQYLFVFGKERLSTPSAGQDKIVLDFFPEGGNMVAGLSTTVAFKASTLAGKPIDVSGSVFNQSGKLVTTFFSTHDGMGMFDLSPIANERYYVLLNGKTEQYQLPTVVSNGIVLTVMPHPQGSFFEVKQKEENEDFIAAYMLGQMQHHIVFRKNFAANQTSFEGVINTRNLHSGIMQITVFNKKGMPLAERLCFVNNNEYLQSATITVDTLNFIAGSKNRFTIGLKDTVQGQISVAITDAAMDMHGTRQQNIVSSLLLTADLKGYIHNPAWYFSSSDDSIKSGLDLLMMTNGWRRFNWTALPASSYNVKKQDPFITLNGKAFLKGTNRPFDNKQLLLMINSQTNKKARSTYFLKTDREGGFRLDSLILFDKNRLLFSDVRGKKSQYIDIELNADSINTGARMLLSNQLFQNPLLPISPSSKWKMDYEAIAKASGLLLDEIKIKAIKKSPLQIIDDKYTAGMFSGDAIKAIDLVNTTDASTYLNIFDYLQSRVNGLTVINDGLDYGLFYRQGPSISSMGNIPMTIFLDEVETDAAVVATIPANQIALLKIYSTFVGGWGNAAGGAIAIYTKKGADYVSNNSLTSSKLYTGYSITKEFFAPNYKTNTDGIATDNRTTLEWRPAIFINNINPKIPVSFYNNNRTQSFKVVVEGMTTDGKLIWLERVVN